jgi:MSHA biogenesis protein MshJ
VKQTWQRWCERIDAMVLRERAIVFVAAALVVVFLFFALLGNPVTDRERQIARQLAHKQVDTRAIQEQVQKLLGARGDDPDAARWARIDDLKRRIAQVDARLAEKQRELVPAERIPVLLEEMLRRERKLELVDLRSLPAVALFGEKDGTGEATTAARAGLQVYRHGVELTVRGTYFDLLRYLRALERLPLRMFWKDVDLTTAEYPTITMKLTVYTLSLERAWVVV